MVAVPKYREIAFHELTGTFLSPPAFFPPANCRAIREVGRGGMAIVYEALSTPSERVALKVSLPCLPHYELARFTQEATIGRSLQHPGVPRILQHGHFEGGAWLTMEYVDGPSLEEVIDDPRFTVAERLDLLYAVADTLQHAHERGVVHRDVKPANIILAPEHPKLLDFGIAKVTNVTMTNPEHLVGTPTHMAPEQLFGDDIDHRADIFQLGVLTHELFADCLPWDGEHPVRIAWAVCYEEPASLSANLRRDLGIPRELIPQLEALVRAALSRNPDHRPSTAAEFRTRIQALRRIIGRGSEIRFGSPQWDVADALVLLGPAELSLHLPASRELIFANAAEDALVHLAQDPRRRLIVDCEAVGHDAALDILDVVSSWRRDGSVTLLCDDPDWTTHYILRGIRVIPHHAINQIHGDLLAA